MKSIHYSCGGPGGRCLTGRVLALAVLTTSSLYMPACSDQSDDFMPGIFREDSKHSELVLALYPDHRFWLSYPDDTRGSVGYEGNYRIEGLNIILEPISQEVQRLALPAQLQYSARSDVILVAFDDSKRRYDIQLVRDLRY